ncbi:MAG: bifunctional hydroxymethylpyrimidine kinase/phosphomethylpyrimidine kinase [Acidimicrobiales bacterium]
MTTPAVALTIAGLDPTGGAGLAADLRTFDAFGVHGAAVVTTLTVQDTSTFVSAEPTDVTLLAAQLERLLGDLDVAAVKIGMVPSVEILQLLGSLAPKLPRLVLDPVAVDRHGSALVGSRERDEMLSGLLAACEIVTPNRAELAWLLDTEIAPEGDAAMLERQVHELRGLGAASVVVTGGRGGTSEAVDIFVGPESRRVWSEQRLPTRNDRGSGCTFSAAIAAALAQGDSVERAVGRAHDFVQRAILAAIQWRIGSGTGPVNQRTAGRGHATPNA